MPDQIYNVKWNDVTKKAYVYDGLGRITSETVYPVNSSTNALESTYTYKNLTGNNTTTLVSGLDNAAGTTFFTYDANGNIIQTMHCDSNLPTLYYEATYSYDKFNQLTGYSDDQTGKSYTFAYDDNGNITTYRVNGINKTFGYTDSVWGDLLTSYNGNTITYDEIGNPLTYKNGETFTWENGRQLNFIFKDNDILAVYSYDSDGKRVSKYTDDGDTFFTYAGDILAGQKTGDNVLVWIYDNNGKYIGFTYNGTEYYYIYNLHGDVVALADSTGTIIARYTYGPWGTVDAVTDNAGNDISANSTHIANINPIRYRGYYYDTETGFYYLTSRYYDPEICRFINADAIIDNRGVNTANLYEYCWNNPILNIDLQGNWTFGISIGANATLLFGISISIGIFFDDNKNFDLQWSYSVPGVDDTMSVGAFDIGLGGSIQYTNRDTVYDLYGPATYIGVSGGPSWYVGGDVITFSSITDQNSGIDGAQITAGVGVGMDAHITKTNTKSVVKKTTSKTTTHVSSSGAIHGGGGGKF